MAKRRYGSKRKKRTAKTGHRKSSKRARAGRKAWRTMIRRYGSKAKAVAALRRRLGRSRKRRSSGRRRRRR